MLECIKGKLPPDPADDSLLPLTNGSRSCKIKRNLRKVPQLGENVKLTRMQYKVKGQLKSHKLRPVVVIGQLVKARKANREGN